MDTRLAPMARMLSLQSLPVQCPPRWLKTSRRSIKRNILARVILNTEFRDPTVDQVSYPKTETVSSGDLLDVKLLKKFLS